ncbi:hypothetical protein [Streptomyces xantholiticus]|uniref:Uncharacterized protein n=1 Tax=Streptomyces xantholiticus TaxID=68285 RepID=A0ABV1UYS1_9ACTN
MLTFAVALKDKGVPVPDIAKKFTIKTGKNAGKSPSVASLYRALAEAEAEAAAVDEGLPLRPKPVRIRRPGEPLTAEEIELREGLQASPTRTPSCGRPARSPHRVHDHRLGVNRCALRPKAGNGREDRALRPVHGQAD